MQQTSYDSRPGAALRSGRRNADGRANARPGSSSQLTTSQPPFFALLFVAEMLLFAKEGPVNSAILWSVGEDLKPHAMAMSMLTAHLFGDIPSPPILGWMLDATADFTKSYMCAPGHKPDDKPLPTTCVAGVDRCATQGAVACSLPSESWSSPNITSCSGALRPFRWGGFKAHGHCLALLARGLGWRHHDHCACRGSDRKRPAACAAWRRRELVSAEPDLVRDAGRPV